MSKNVLVITNNLQQAAFRLRIAALQSALAKQGIFFDIFRRPRNWFLQTKLFLAAKHYDAVILQRKLLEPWDIAILRRSGKPLFFDVDDAVMVHSRPVGRFKQWESSRRFAATARGADMVVAGSHYLAGIFRKQGVPAVVVPTTVKPDDYPIRKHGPAPEFRLAWVGAKSTLPYLRQFLPAMAKANVPGMKIVVIADETIPDSPVPIEFVRWSITAETAALASADVGIAPTPLDPWTHGKCGFKIIQYMAAGLPVIASPVAANSDIVVEGQTGFLPAQSDGWVPAIERLAQDLALRARLGAAGRSRLEQNYTNQIAADAWAQLLHQI